MLKKRKGLLGQLLVRQADFESVWDEICENNRKMVVIFSSICAAILSVLVVLGCFSIAVDPEDTPRFGVALLCAIGILFLTRRTSRQSHDATMFATYLTMGAMMFYGIMISYRSPEHYTVSFIAMMGILSMSFVDKPSRLFTANALGTALCVLMVWFRKAEGLRVSDTINIVSFSAMSCIGGFFTANIKVRSYVVARLYEQEVQKGKQRLKEVEMEALQLLTAVRESYECFQIGTL